MTKPSKSTSSGFTLVELMVAITLALVLMVFVVQMFMASVASFKVAREQALMQENGRFAATSLRRAIASADAWGCVGNRNQVADTRGNIPNNPPLTGGNNAPPNSDTLTIRSGTTWRETTLAAAVNNGGTGTQLNLNNASAVTGNTVLVSDCMHGDIVDLDSSAAITNGSLNHPESQYAAGSRVTRAQNTTFSVQTANGRQCLQRARNGTTSNLLCGIEQMHLRYGEDITGNGSPNNYRTANNVANWGSVIAVRAAFVVRSQSVVQSATATYNVFGTQFNATNQGNPAAAGRARRVVTTTVPVRNRKF